MRRTALLLFMAFTACDAEKNADATLGGIKKAKDAAAKVTARANTSEANEIGIAECDEYIRKYESCLAEKVPEEKRGELRATLDAQRRQWQGSVTAGEDQATIKRQCETEMDSAKRTLNEYGCAF